MPLEHAVGEVVGAAVEFVGDIVVDATDSKKRSWTRRVLYGTLTALLGGFLALAIGIALA